MRISRAAFERLVVRALDSLPEEILAELDNVDVVVEPEPDDHHLRTAGVEPGETLYGLYEGVPLTARDSAYGLVLPDKITIFQGPIMREARDEADAERIVRETVLHEIAHHFGISDERLWELGRY